MLTQKPKNTHLNSNNTVFQKNKNPKSYIEVFARKIHVQFISYTYTKNLYTAKKFTFQILNSHNNIFTPLQ